jgi:hypothetical protein
MIRSRARSRRQSMRVHLARASGLKKLAPAVALLATSLAAQAPSAIPARVPERLIDMHVHAWQSPPQSESFKQSLVDAFYGLSSRTRSCQRSGGSGRSGGPARPGDAAGRRGGWCWKQSSLTGRVHHVRATSPHRGARRVGPGVGWRAFDGNAARTLPLSGREERNAGWRVHWSRSARYGKAFSEVPYPARTSGSGRTSLRAAPASSRVFDAGRVALPC